LKIDLLIRDRVDNLLAEGFDLAARFGEPEHPGLCKRHVLDSRIITCASNTYVAQYGTPSTPQELHEEYRCIRLIDDVTGRPHSWNFLKADGTEHSIAPDCNITVNDAPSLLAAAFSDFGIVRLLDFMVEEHLRSGRLVEILPEWNHRTWPAYLYAPERSHCSAALGAFMDFVCTTQFQSATREE
jgi:DNA-binding transcriptional LysR family regulator